jgi:hypothetical protein
MKEEYFNLISKLATLKTKLTNRDISHTEYVKVSSAISEVEEELNKWAKKALTIVRNFSQKHPDLYKRYKIEYPSHIHSIESRMVKNAIAISGKDYWGEGEYSDLITCLIPLQLLEDEEGYKKTREEYVRLQDIEQVKKDIVEIKRRAKTCVYQLETKEEELKELETIMERQVC